MKKPTVKQVIAKATFVFMNSTFTPTSGFTISKQELTRRIKDIETSDFKGNWRGKVVMSTLDPNIAVITDKKGNEPHHPDFEGNDMFAHLFTLIQLKTDNNGFISINTDNSFWNDHCKGK